MAGLAQPTQMRLPKAMLAYGIANDETEIITMIATALAQQCAGNVGINVSNVGIASFVILMTITHLHVQLHGAAQV